MTVSSCRVQLIGLPQTATTNPTNPPALTVTRVSRNLFGSPQRGEIKQLLDNELQQNWRRFRQRYSFDIIEKNSTNVASDNSIKESSHELRLSAAVESDLSASSPIVKKAVASCNVEKSSGLNSNCNGVAGGDRLKPYARQSLLTDCYNLRKLTQCHNKISNVTIKSSTANIIIGKSQPSRELSPNSKPIAALSSEEPSGGTETLSRDNTSYSFYPLSPIVVTSATDPIVMNLTRRESEVDSTGSERNV